MLLPFLLCVLVLYAPLPPGGEAAPWAATVVGVLVLAALNALAGWAGSTLAIRLALRPGRRGGMAALRIFTALKGCAVGLVAADVFALHWPVFVQGLLGASRWTLVAFDALLLLPAVAMIFTVMAFQHRVETRLTARSIPLARYLWLRFRVELAIVLVPWLLLVLATDLVDAAFLDSPHARTADMLATLGVLACLLAGSPLLLRFIWSTSRLPDGPLRGRLEAFCRAQSFRCDGILVWHTGHHLTNAGVVGPTHLLRYVMITDNLLDYCTEGEVAAVFAHEVGHVRRHHLSLYMLFAGAFLCIYANLMDLGAAFGWVRPLGDIFALDMTLRQGLVMVALAGVYWALVFGFVSRRLEQEADLFSIWSIEQPVDFLTALEKLAALGGTPRAAAHWRHFSIARRVAWLQRVLENPEVGRRFVRRLRVLKIVILAAFALLLARLLIVRPELFGM
jgi:STE24 endopeptidase